MIIASSPRVSKRGSAAQRSFILHEQACTHFWEGSEALSIKTFFRGQGLYSVGRGYYAVDEGSYLILNQGQSYTITIDAATPVESFCVFFAPGFAEEVQYNLVTRTEGLIDEPVCYHNTPLHFYERTYPRDGLIMPALLALRTSLAQKYYEPGWLETQFHEMMTQLLHVHQNVQREVEALPAVRATTRQEIYRRLYQAKDSINALFDQPLTLADMAGVAHLSPNHFLRLFKSAFHQTPHQYLIDLRLARAQQLLVQTECSITDVCLAVGFESLGSFSWLFRQRTGCSPMAYRLQNK